jgi:hypothetical protein
MDLTKLSDSDLKAIADGNLEALSTEALQMLAGEVEPQQEPSIFEKLKGAFAFEPFTREMAGGMFEEPALGIAQLVTKGLGVGEESVERMIQEREQRIQATPGGEAGRITGMIASPATALFAGNLPSLIRQIPRIGQSPVAQSAAVGGGASLMTPVTEGDFAEQKALQAGTGAVAGPVLDVLASPFARMGTPGGATPELQRLQQAGVDVSRLTPGQQLGGTAKRIEESLKSVPFAGEVVRQAELRTFQDFNKGLLNNVVQQVNPKAQIPKAFDTRGAVEFVEKEISKAYNKGLANIKFPVSDPFRNQVESIASKYAANLSDENAKLLQKLVKNNVLDMMPANKVVPGGTLKRIDSDLGKFETQYLRSATSQDKTIGQALQEIKAEIRAVIGNQDPTGEIKAANAAFADFLRIQAAAGQSRSPGGVFSPEQLMSATRSLDASLRKGQFARGQARMQKTAEAAREVMGTRVPDSGTPERLGTTLAALGLTGAVGGGYTGVPPESLIIPGLLTGLYTRPGQTALRGLSQLGPGLRSALPVLGPQFTPQE